MNPKNSFIFLIKKPLDKQGAYFMVIRANQ
jgi:hypothetical protein